MPLLFDNDWLRNRIEADPDDSELSAGTTTSPDPTPYDDLVTRLRNPSLSCSKGQRGDIHHEAAARIVELGAENAKLRRVVEAAGAMRSYGCHGWYLFDAALKELDAL